SHHEGHAREQSNDPSSARNMNDHRVSVYRELSPLISPIVGRLVPREHESEGVRPAAPDGRRAPGTHGRAPDLHPRRPRAAETDRSTLEGSPPGRTGKQRQSDPQRQGYRQVARDKADPYSLAPSETNSHDGTSQASENGRTRQNDPSRGSE